jgi:hypothetical protein
MPAPRDAPGLDQSSVAALATALIGFVVLAWLTLRPVSMPAPPRAAAPPAVFAAARAERDMVTLAQAPRTDASARDYIVSRLRALGLEPQVQSASAARVTRQADSATAVQAALVHNIVVRKPGAAPNRARRPALLVAAHYDRAPAGTPAPDPSATVAAMLETLRALDHGAPLANDLIFLFTDGENLGALGARAFAEQHPWARQVGVVLQFDAVGNSGPLLMTGARGDNGALIAGWIAHAPRPRGSSAFALLAGKAPGLRQGAPLDALGVAGMRFAAIEGGHADPNERLLAAPLAAPLADPLAAANGEAFMQAAGAVREQSGIADAATQHAGDTMLALTRHFGNVPLAGIGALDHLHFDLPLVGQVHYDQSYVWPLTRLVCLMVAIACCIAVQRSGVPAGRLLAGASAFFATAAVLVLAATTLWSGAAQAAGAAVRDGWVLLAVIALALAVFIECQRLLLKAIGLPAAMLGALLVMTALLLGASVALPGASYLLAWPMTGALLAYAAVQAPPIAARSSALRLAILMSGSAPAVLLFAPLLQQMSTLLTFQRSLLLVLVLALMLGLGTAPLAALRRRYVSPLLLLVCAASLTAAARAMPEPAPPAPAPVTYLKDAISWQSWWLTADGAAPAAATGIGEHGAVLAPRSAVAFPELLALRDDVHGERRHVVFTVRSRNDSPLITLRVEGTPTLSATIDGALLTSWPSSTWTASLHGTAGQLHRFELELVAGTTARVYVQERKPGLPAGTRLAGAAVAGTTIAADMLEFR